MQGQYSLRSPAVKRLMKEAEELSVGTDQYHAQPLDDNLFEWHFTIRGPSDSDYEGGIYHGRIILPTEYPMKPPSIILLTDNGRFELYKKICLSISGYHPESWQPSWSIRTALLAIIGFMPTHGKGAIGSLDHPPERRKHLAKKSREFICNVCGPIKDILKEETAESKAAGNAEAKLLGSQINMLAEKPKRNNEINKTEETDKHIKDEKVSNETTSVKENNPINAEVKSTPVIASNSTSENSSNVQESVEDDNVMQPSDHIGQHSSHGVSTNNKSVLIYVLLLIVVIVILVIRRLYSIMATETSRNEHFEL